MAETMHQNKVLLLTGSFSRTELSRTNEELIKQIENKNQGSPRKQGIQVASDSQLAFENSSFLSKIESCQLAKRTCRPAEFSPICYSSALSNMHNLLFAIIKNKINTWKDHLNVIQQNFQQNSPKLRTSCLR